MNEKIKKIGEEIFSSPLGLLLPALGMAIGTGNIWRFPRVAAANGGGVFIILWIFFLFCWSIPLLSIESALGRRCRRGTLGSFKFLCGTGGMWMGGFIALTTTGIMCYYTVVTGWCLKYFIASLSGAVNDQTGAQYWHEFAGSWQAVAYHLAAAFCVGAVVLAGVRRGIEATAKVFIPLLALILVYSAIKALLLPGAGAGVEYLFSINPADFLSPKIYLEALTQSAWSTGAGWGLLLTYSVYAQPREQLVKKTIFIGLGNNAASLLAALAVIPTIFAFLPASQAMEVAQTTGENSTGLTFIWIPKLLGQGGGQSLLVLFFLALLLAAFSSLISLMELAVKNLIDLGLSRKKSTLLVVALISLVGTPSALWSAFFDNQDWVWSLGLLICGMLFCVAVGKYGVSRFRQEIMNHQDSGDFQVGKSFEVLVLLLIPLEGVLVLGWWLYRSVGWNALSWWNPLETFSIGTCLAQWGLGIGLLIWLGPRLARRLDKSGQNIN